MNSVNGEIALFGCGGHSRSVADLLLANNPNVLLVFIDVNAREGETIYGFPVVKEYPSDNLPVFLAIGDNMLRKAMFEEISITNLISIISCKAHIGFGAFLDVGCFVGNFCHIGPDVIIGKNTIVNNGAVVEHEVKVGCHCHIGPNVTISGRSKIGDLVFVGVGATIMENVSICSNVTIGAGATVVKNIEEPGVYIGTPVKRVK